MSVVGKEAKGAGLLVEQYKPHTPRTQSHPKPWSKRGKKPRESRKSKRERLARLLNEPVPQLFQNHPTRLAVGYKASGWTRTVEGYWRSANQRLKTVLKNNRMLGRRLTHLVNINLEAPRHPEFINRDFRAFLKILEKHGVSGHWTIEISSKNIVHWHLLFQNYQGSHKSLKRLVERCLDQVETFPKHRVFADQIKKQRQKLEYVLKVKKAGYGDVFNPLGETVPTRGPVRRDIYGRDRLLFASNTGLAKNGTFGDFWAKDFNEKKFWKLIREQTAEVEKNYGNPRIRQVVDEIHKRFGIPLSRVKWSVCLNPASALLEPSSAPSVPLHDRGSQRRPSRSSSGLVGLVFRSARNRHSVPVMERKHPAVFNASRIGPIGSPRSTPQRRLQERLQPHSVGLSRDTKWQPGIARLWDVLTVAGTWIGKICPLFQKQEFRNSKQKTTDLGP